MLARHRLLLAAALSMGIGIAPSLAKQQDSGGWIQNGVATWYGADHAGRRTSSGETFNPALMTAAHASLPLGSYVRVTVEASGSSIIVKVNDRAPPRASRCIDLSHGAAARLGIVNAGRARVTLAAVSADEAAAADDELAEAPDDAVNDADASRAVASIVRHGRRHRHHAAR